MASYPLDYYTYTIKVAGITDSVSIQTKAGISHPSLDYKSKMPLTDNLY